MKTITKSESASEQKQSWLRARVQEASKHAKNDEELGIAKLLVRRWKGRELEIDDGKILVDFLTCSYLSLDQHHKALNAVNNFRGDNMSVQLASARTRVVSKSTRDLEIGSEAKASDVTYELQKAGFLVASSSYPRVAKGAAVLRICINALHNRDQIERLVKLLDLHLTKVGAATTKMEA